MLKCLCSIDLRYAPCMLYRVNPQSNHTIDTLVLDRFSDQLIISNNGNAARQRPTQYRFCLFIDEHESIHEGTEQTGKSEKLYLIASSARVGLGTWLALLSSVFKSKQNAVSERKCNEFAKFKLTRGGAWPRCSGMVAANGRASSREGGTRRRRASAA